MPDLDNAEISSDESLCGQTVRNKRTRHSLARISTDNWSVVLAILLRSADELFSKSIYSKEKEFPENFPDFLELLVEI